MSGPGRAFGPDPRAQDPGMEEILEALVAAADALPEPQPLPKAPAAERRVVGAVHDDPLNAIVRHVRVSGDRAGGLAGVRVSLKDSLACAEIPMTCGSAALAGFTPSGDSTVARRLLAAGAEIVAITNMDDLAFSGGGDTGHFGPVANPYDHALLAGGSSGGAAASLHYDGIDVAIGTDQGGSVRVPAAWCGVIGLKPTRGLIPYTGVATMESSLDHVGILAADAPLLGRVLRTLAGPDGLDARQAGMAFDAFHASFDWGFDLRDKRAAVLLPLADACDDDVRAAFGRDVDALRALGLHVEHASWDPAAVAPIATALFVEGFAAALAGQGGSGGPEAHVWIEFTRALQHGVREHWDRLSPAVRVTLRAAEQLALDRPGEARARAAAAARKMREQLDAVLEGVDFVLNPTTPFMPFGAAASDAERVARGWKVLSNTGFANVTGHPSISIPGSPVGGLPTGLMVTARHGADAQLVRFAGELVPVSTSPTPPHERAAKSEKGEVRNA